MLLRSTIQFNPVKTFVFHYSSPSKRSEMLHTCFKLNSLNVQKGFLKSDPVVTCSSPYSLVSPASGQYCSHLVWNKKKFLRVIPWQEQKTADQYHYLKKNTTKFQQGWEPSRTLLRVTLKNLACCMTQIFLFKLTRPPSTQLVTITMPFTFCSQIILQKSLTVDGSGPWVAIYSLLFL